MSWRDRYFEEGYLQRWHLAPPGEAQFEEAAAGESFDERTSPGLVTVGEKPRSQAPEA